MAAASQAEILSKRNLPKPPLRGPLRLSCPVCLREMGEIDPLDTSAQPACSSCGFLLPSRQGIWRALDSEREQRFRQFVLEYQEVRAQEGRGSSRPDFYLALPYEDLTGRNSWQWKIRGRTFCLFEEKVLPPMEQQYARKLDVLDLGAGNCWMSYRLAWKGHRPVAVDLLDNTEDGLGAAQPYFSHLGLEFPRFQAEFDRLPFAAQQFDLALFNASFHYSENYERTLREALRCLRQPGHLVILDSPFYKRDESGRRMIKERQAAFVKKFGFPSNSILSCEYLTGQTLEQLACACGLRWKILKPWYGLRWALRPLIAGVWRRREPSKFYILWAEVLNDRSL